MDDSTHRITFCRRVAVIELEHNRIRLAAVEIGAPAHLVQ